MKTKQIGIGLSTLALAFAAALPGALLAPRAALADDTTPSASATPSASSDDSENKRIQAYEGSHSRWSGQVQMTYSGSMINHPFAAEIPNPGGQVPPPVVSLSGVFAGRYRIDDKTTMGLGIGVTTYTPFQGPTNTSAANPQFDLAHAFKIGPIHNLVDGVFTWFTDNNYHQTFGYNTQFTVDDQAFYTFKSGFTAGVFLEIDAATFSTSPQYWNSAIQSEQTGYDIVTDPYFEYKLSNRVNLRSVIGIIMNHNNNDTRLLGYQFPDIYQTLGVGVSVIDAVYVYTYVRGQPYQEAVNDRNLFFGFSTVINLF